MKKRQSVEQVQEHHFEQRMGALVEQRVSPSLAVIAVRGDDTVVARGYGWSDLGQRTKASAETIYLYCSITKLFTATALMQLREGGLVELDREVRAYLPDFPLRHPSGREVTVRHLLSHSSGIANPIPVSWVHLAEEPSVNLDDFTKRLLAKYRRLHFEPGSRYAYSNLGYLVLGQVIERLSGQSYTDYIRQQILEVLDMHRTDFSYDSLQDQDVATGYVRSWTMMGLLGRFLVDRRLFGATRKGYTAFQRFLIDGAPYGGLLGPVSDLGNFLKAYLSGGTFQGRRLLEPVQRFTVVDNSDFSPSGLTSHSDSPYDQETIPVTHFKQRGSLWTFMCSCSCSWSVSSSCWRGSGVLTGSIFGLPIHEVGPGAACSTVCSSRAAQTIAPPVVSPPLPRRVQGGAPPLDGG